MSTNNKFKILIITILVISWLIIGYALMADISHQLSIYLLIAGIALLVVAMVMYLIKE
jgi:uncharacterized membrane protein